MPVLGESELPLRGNCFAFSGLVFVGTRNQFHSDQFAHAAFLHRHAVEHIGLRDGAFVVGDDDELALLDEALEHGDEAVDVTLIERRVDFVEHAKRTRSHHVNCEEKRHRRHCALASAQQRNTLQLFARRFGRDLNPAVEWIAVIEQRQVRAAAAEEFREHFAKVHVHLGEGFREQFLRG